MSIIFRTLITIVIFRTRQQHRLHDVQMLAYTGTTFTTLSSPLAPFATQPASSGMRNHGPPQCCLEVNDQVLNCWIIRQHTKDFLHDLLIIPSPFSTHQDEHQRDRTRFVLSPLFNNACIENSCVNGFLTT